MNNIKGKNVVITGGTSGIGKATALLLAENGANVFIIGRDEKRLNEVAEKAAELGVKSGGRSADVGDYSSFSKAFDQVDSIFKQIDIFINNASLPARSILNTNPDDYLSIVQTNLIGYMNGFQLAIDRMSKFKKGHIVVTVSQAVKYKDPEADLYVATKTGVDGLTESLVPVLKNLGIRVTKINPGNVATGMVSEGGVEKKELVKKGMMISPEEIAETILMAIKRPENVNIDEVIISPFKKI